MRKRYATLSYFWGRKGHFTTTRATLLQRLEKIPKEDLPQTFQDSVALTRSLGLRYLWIDAICIYLLSMAQALLGRAQPHPASRRALLRLIGLCLG
jgi:hypothetical protein